MKPVPSTSRRPPQEWFEALALMQSVLLRARCPKPIIGQVVGDMTAHKVARERRRAPSGTRS